MNEKNPPSFIIASCSDDDAVSAVGGRPGAALGPDAVRPFFQKQILNLGAESSVEWIECDPRHYPFDTRHKSTANNVRELADNKFPIWLGGSHDYGFSQLYCDHLEGELGCINIDAHYDLRPDQPQFTSGSPFRRALEQGTLAPEHFVEFGIQPQSNSMDLREYANNHSLRTLTLRQIQERSEGVAAVFQIELERLKRSCSRIAISFDLDACASSYAPGVSAPQSDGFSAQNALDMIVIAAKSPSVVSVGFFETNPVFDVDHRTSRLTATLMSYFIGQRLGRIS